MTLLSIDSHRVMTLTIYTKIANLNKQQSRPEKKENSEKTVLNTDSEGAGNSNN